MGKMRSHRDLKVWQRALAFAVQIYRVTEAFPSKEIYSLTDQIRRAAVSIPANIAEGHGYSTDKAFARHLDIALGSAAELDTHLQIALEVGYLSEARHQALQEELTTIAKMLHALRNKLRPHRQPLTANCQPPTANR